MANATVGKAAFEPNLALNAVAKSQKTAGITQDFGNVLDKTSQNLKQSDSQVGTAKPSDSKSTQKTELSKEPVSRKDSVSETSVQKEPAQEAPVEESAQLGAAEETVDTETAEEAMESVKQIIEEIKKLLGVSEEEITDAMESIGLQAFELLNSDNMAQLIAAVTGEDTAIGLVADEGLYETLQELIGVVDTQADSLAEELGLTQEELETVLQKLETASEENIVQEDMLGEASKESLNEAVSTETAEQTAPVVVVEDKTSANQRELSLLGQSAESEAGKDATVNLSSQSQKAHEDKHEAKDYGQQHNNLLQNYQNNPNEAVQTVAEAAVERYTSVDTENILRQLADMVKIVKGEEITEMELQLHPASLGTVNVSLTTKGGVVTAEFLTQNEMVKNAIEAQAAQLQANLEEQGVKVEAIEVSVASHQLERDLEEDSRQQQSGEQDRQAERVRGTRKNSINFNSFEDDEELLEEMQGADDATRIAMEMMAINGNSMDLLA